MEAMWCKMDLKAVTQDNNSEKGEESSYKLEKEMSLGGSGGNLPKWQLSDEKGFSYAKGRSKDNTYEPEAESCAYRLALLFGVPAIQYKLVNLSSLSEKPVCISRDYSDGYKVMSLFRFVELVKHTDPAKLNGKSKYELVTSVLNKNDIILHDKILFFDYIVGNTDRHLRNFDVRVNAEGNLVNLVDMFDTGAAFFSDESVDTIRRACGAGNNFVHSKPYGDPHKGQLRILQEELKCKPMLNKVSKINIYKIINNCFGFTGDERAKYLGHYVVQNAERLGLICQE
jgi:hypothetical protein